MQEVNLLPIQFRRHQAAKLILTRWFVFSGIAIIAGMALWISYGSDDANSGLTIDELKQKADPLEETARKSRILNADIKRLSKQWELLSRLEAHGDILQTIGVIGVACRKVDDMVTVKSLNLSTDAKPRLVAKQAKDKSRRKKALVAQGPSSNMLMQIETSDDRMSSAMIKTLKMNPRIHSIEIKNAGGINNETNKEETQRITELQGRFNLQGVAK